jgi:hypothetical protein
MCWYWIVLLCMASACLGFLLCSLLCVASRADRDAEHALVVESLTLRAMRAEAMLAEEREQTREAEERIAAALHGEEPR